MGVHRWAGCGWLAMGMQACAFGEGLTIRVDGASMPLRPAALGVHLRPFPQPAAVGIDGGALGVEAGVPAEQRS